MEETIIGQQLPDLGEAFATRVPVLRLRPTISIGVSAFPQDGSGVDLLVRKADEALYRAKNRGRNCVAV